MVGLLLLKPWVNTWDKRKGRKNFSWLINICLAPTYYKYYWSYTSTTIKKWRRNYDKFINYVYAVWSSVRERRGIKKAKFINIQKWFQKLIYDNKCLVCIRKRLNSFESIMGRAGLTYPKMFFFWKYHTRLFSLT